MFLGLLADEWREERQQQQLAERSLERFRVEVAANSDALAGVVKYHQDLRQGILAFLASDAPKTFQAFATQVEFKGIKPVSYERSAWDLAVATGALVYVDSDLVFELSRTYTAQSELERLQEGFSIVSPTSVATPDVTGLAIAMQSYLSDIANQEPRLLERYATLRADLDTAVGAAPASTETAEPPSPQAAAPN